MVKSMVKSKNKIIIGILILIAALISFLFWKMKKSQTIPPVSNIPSKLQNSTPSPTTSSLKLPFPSDLPSDLLAGRVEKIEEGNRLILETEEGEKKITVDETVELIFLPEENENLEIKEGDLVICEFEKGKLKSITIFPPEVEFKSK